MGKACDSGDNWRLGGATAKHIGVNGWKLYTAPDKFNTNWALVRLINNES